MTQIPISQVAPEVSVNTSGNGHALKGIKTIRPRLLIVVHGLSYGGTERQTFLLAKHLHSLGWDIHIALWVYQQDAPYAIQLSQLGIKLHSIPASDKRIARISKLCSLTRQLKPDYIHSFSFYGDFACWCAAKVGRVKFPIGAIRSTYSGHKKVVGGLGGRLCALLPGVKIANSNAARIEAETDSSFFRPGHVWHIPNAIDCDLFSPDLIDRTNRSQVRLIGVGNLFPVKRWTELTRLLRQLIDDGITNWHLTIVGKGPEHESLLKITSELGLERHIELTGSRSDVPQLLRQSDIFIFFSRIEGSPNAVAEAMSVGLPVVSTNVGDVAEMIDNGVEGLLTEIGDDDGYLENLKKLLTDKELREKMGGAARQRIVHERSMEVVLDRFIDVYRQIGWKI